MPESKLKTTKITRSKLECGDDTCPQYDGKGSCKQIKSFADFRKHRQSKDCGFWNRDYGTDGITHELEIITDERGREVSKKQVREVKP